MRYLLDTNPVRTQQRIDPSLTPPRSPRNTRPIAAAMTTMDVSEQILIRPTSFLSLRVRAYTNPSPGSIAAPATICRYTPNASSRIPTSTHSTCRGYQSGSSQSNRVFIERSTRYPNRKQAATSTPMSIQWDLSVLFQSVRATWSPIRRRLNAAV